MRLAFLLLALLAAADWTSVAFVDGSAVAMPGTPKRSVEAPAVEGAATHETWTSRGPEGLYTARLVLSPEADGASGIGRAEVEFMAEDMHGRLTGSRAVTCGVLRGWEFEFQRRKHGDIHYVLWVADPRRDVMLTLKVPLKKPAPDAARRFFDSLSVAE